MEYLAPQIHSKNNQFHSEGKLPWSYDYRLAKHIATYKSAANRDVPVYSSVGYLRKIFPLKGLKYCLLLNFVSIFTQYSECVKWNEYRKGLVLLKCIYASCHLNRCHLHLE